MRSITHRLPRSRKPLPGLIVRYVDGSILLSGAAISGCLRIKFTERDNSMALHFAFLRTLNFRVSVVGRSSFAGGFFSLTAGNFEGSGFGGFISTSSGSSSR